MLSMALLAGGWRNPGFLPALISVPLFADLLTAHATSQLGLTGLCLAAWAQPRRRCVLLGAGLSIGLIRPPNALPLVPALLYCPWPNPFRLFHTPFPPPSPPLPPPSPP